MERRIIHIDEMVQICGYFTTETTVNNGYGCKHPDQEEQDEDLYTGRQHGKCYAFNCPLAPEADLQDMKELDQELYDEWKNEEYDPTEMGGNYLVVDESVLRNAF
jgi:hypothetical protein